VSGVLLVASFAVLLGGAYLFTNAIEWAGHRMRLGEGAVGSLLAAVGTALPESIVPAVALVGGARGADGVAIGAILGAPFMLATIAMALVGLSTIAFRARRPSGTRLDAHVPTLRRDLACFTALLAVALVLGLGAPAPLRVAVAIGLVAAYAAYVRATLAGAGGGDGPLPATLHLDPSRHDPPANAVIALQLLLALGAIVGGSYLFVEELLHVADSLGVSALVLALVLAPLATELPEKANSILWTRQGKDTLALGNVTGALVFQSTLPVALGLALTDWELSGPSLLAGGLSVVGGLLALTLLRRGRFGPPAILAWAGLYAVFVAYVVAAG
jgi:cation:H+ antiporter